MQISMTLQKAENLAARSYHGASVPLTVRRSHHAPLDCDWWRGPHKVERFNSDRHQGALSLYLALAGRSAVELPAYSFPSAFHFGDGEQRIPDKGFIKMCLNAEPPVLSCRSMQGHLIFDLTDAGQALLETA